MTVTPTGGDGDYDDYWWVDEAALQKDLTAPGKFYKTAGTSVSHSVDTGAVASRKVCQRCFEKVLRRSAVDYGDEAPVAFPPPVIQQEF